MLELIVEEISKMYSWPYSTYLEPDNPPALQTLQNGNESYCTFQLHKAMTVQVIQPHNVRKATTVQAAGNYQFQDKASNQVEYKIENLKDQLTND